MAKRKRTRQIDVANRAGVSTAVVSQVLNGREGGSIRVGEATEKRVWEAVRELGYVPNPVAQSLASGQSNLLGVFTFESIFPERQHGFYYPFLLGVEEEAEAQGYDLILFTSTSVRDSHRNIFRDGTNRLQLADGAVLLGREQERGDIERLLAEEFPFVFIGRRAIGTGLSYVAADYAAATETVVGHLQDLGHRRIAFIGTGAGTESALDRERGFRQARAAAGIGAAEIDTALHHRPHPTEAFVAGLVETGVTAVLAENDSIGLAVLNAAAALGYPVPERLSMAVLGDPLEPLAAVPDWTSFEIPRREMGREAVRMLLRLIAEPLPEGLQVSLPCRFGPGATTAPPATGSA